MYTVSRAILEFSKDFRIAVLCFGEDSYKEESCLAVSKPGCGDRTGPFFSIRLHFCVYLAALVDNGAIAVAETITKRV